MSYPATLDYLFHQLPMFQRIGPAAFKKDLTNIRLLCKALGDPQNQFTAIHLAGTNGKGSTAHMMAAVWQAAGYKVGVYTSPHYKDFRERIKINGKFIPKAQVVDFVAEHRPLFDEIKPSFFEITVALAFSYFAKKKVDFAIIETGLGGRLDSTNIIQPALSVITNISFDHQQFLGDTLPLIAGEKAGIIKAATPVVIGETRTETQAVFQQKAQQEEAPIYFADQIIEAKAIGGDLSKTFFEVKKNGETWLPNLAVEVKATYQALNLQTALLSLSLLADQGIAKWTMEDLQTGLGQLRQLTRFLGRWQVLQQEPLVIADSAHNEGGLRPTLAQLRNLPHENLFIVLGTVNDKDLDKVLPLFPKQARYFFAKAKIPRALPAADLKTAAATHGLQGRAYSSVRNAFKAAKRAANPDDLIFIGGSIFVVAEVI